MREKVIRVNTKWNEGVKLNRYKGSSEHGPNLHQQPTGGTRGLITTTMGRQQRLARSAFSRFCSQNWESYVRVKLISTS